MTSPESCTFRAPAQRRHFLGTASLFPGSQFSCFIMVSTVSPVPRNLTREKKLSLPRLSTAPSEHLAQAQASIAGHLVLRAPHPLRNILNVTTRGQPWPQCLPTPGDWQTTPSIFRNLHTCLQLC